MNKVVKYNPKKLSSIQMKTISAIPQPKCIIFVTISSICRKKYETRCLYFCGKFINVS